MRHDLGEAGEHPAAHEGQQREGGQQAEAGVDLTAARDLAPLARFIAPARSGLLCPLTRRAGHTTPPSPSRAVRDSDNPRSSRARPMDQPPETGVSGPITRFFVRRGRKVERAGTGS